MSGGDLVLLPQYDEARRALDEAVRVDEVKAFHDEVKAREAYARIAKDHKLEADCIELRMRAARKLGELIKRQAETVGLSKGGRPPKTGADTDPVKPATLAEAGIDKHLASKARTLGKLDDEAFEQAVAETKAAAQRAEKNVVKRRTISHERAAYIESTKDGATIADLAALAATGYRAGVIYVDPPWEFETYGDAGKDRSPEQHYDTMTVAEISTMGPLVDQLAAPDCVLMLWGVFPALPGALAVIEAWGFKYSTAGFLWIKTTKADEPATGLGYWTRANGEPCLLATRGNPFRLNADVHQVISAPRGGHSEKPDEARDRIRRLVAGPYLELFGRKLVPGWTVWGNQIPRDQFVAAAE